MRFGVPGLPEMRFGGWVAGVGVIKAQYGGGGDAFWGGVVGGGGEHVCWGSGRAKMLFEGALCRGGGGGPPEMGLDGVEGFGLYIHTGLGLSRGKWGGEAGKIRCHRGGSRCDLQRAFRGTT